MYQCMVEVMQVISIGELVSIILIEQIKKSIKYFFEICLIVFVFFLSKQDDEV